MRVLSEVVYRLNRIGPRTEPWGTPHVREDEEERCGEMETADVRDYFCRSHVKIATYAI